MPNAHVFPFFCFDKVNLFYFFLQMLDSSALIALCIHGAKNLQPSALFPLRSDHNQLQIIQLLENLQLLTNQ